MLKIDLEDSPKSLIVEDGGLEAIAAFIVL